MFLLKLTIVSLLVAMVVCYPVEKKVESDKVTKQEKVVEQGSGGKKNEKQQGSESINHYAIPTILFGYHPFPYYLPHYFPHTYGGFGASQSSYYGSGSTGVGNSAGYGHANFGNGFGGSANGFGGSGHVTGGSNYGSIGSGYGSSESGYGSVGSGHGSSGSGSGYNGVYSAGSGFGSGHGYGQGGHGGSLF